MVETLIIEGGSDIRNGSLRRGFHELLSKEINEDIIPRIIMGNGKNEAIKKFLSKTKSVNLLIDLDKNESFRNEDLINNNLKTHENRVFYMIQEMEAWFLSQTDILTSFYPDINWDDIIMNDISEIQKPSDDLKDFTRQSKSRMYHKIKHSVKLLPLLNTKKLAIDFPDFKKLIDSIKN